jgi:nucleoside-diphosphate-sugar epimerase
MQLVVTGAGTELGQELLRAIVARGVLCRGDGSGAVPVQRILGVDRIQPAALFVDERIEYVRGDYEQPRFLAHMMGTAIDSVFHLSARDAAIGLGPDVDDMELALLRSLDTTRALLDACRSQAHPPRLVFAGLGGLRATAGAVPATLAALCVDVCESLLVESARRGVIDLRSLRLPGPAGADTTAPDPMLDPVLDPALAAAALLDLHEQPAVLPAVQICELDQTRAAIGRSRNE